MTKIVRKTEVVSISLPKSIARALDEISSKRRQSRSSFIASLIEKESEDTRWKLILEEGRKIGKKFNIKSEEDIDRILHESS